MADDAKCHHRVYCIPGMFGFGRLAGYDYFHHVKSSLRPHFWSRDLKVTFIDVPSPPTSSLRRRAQVLERTIAHTCGEAGPIHLLGHSTGGLDARLILAPTVNIGVAHDLQAWRPRVQSLITLNTPHYGTPLATYFATVSGTRMLYALSLLTAVSLRLSEPSLAIFSRVLSGINRIDSLFGKDTQLLTKATSGILRFVDKEGRGEITDYLSKVKSDQGAVIQITPEAMDLFNAAVENAEDIRYGCIVAASPRPSSLRAARRIRSAYMAFTATLYTSLYRFTSQRHEQYGYALPSADELQIMSKALRGAPTDESSDGIVPALSMLWGELVWAEEADHLDTLGHFHDDQKPAIHTDWLTSGTKLTRERFHRLMQKVSEFQLA